MNDTKLLQKVFASTYVLYNKTQQLHWNLKTPNFLSFHKLFAEHYQNYQMALDEMAETIVAMDNNIKAKLSEVLKDSILKEDVASFDDIKLIIKDLVKDHNELVNFMEDAYKNTKSVVIQDFYASRLKFHQTAVWMLKASL